MESLPKESRIILALEALKKDPKLSVRKAAAIYDIPRSSLGDRRAGIQPRRELPANSRKLTDLEEKVILERVLDLDARGFPPRLSDLREMADSSSCGTRRVACRTPMGEELCGPT